MSRRTDIEDQIEILDERMASIQVKINELEDELETVPKYILESGAVYSNGQGTSFSLARTKCPTSSTMEFIILNLDRAKVESCEHFRLTEDRLVVYLENGNYEFLGYVQPHVVQCSEKSYYNKFPRKA
tara:strand:- start:511 stop:894 length:384 start_codon:yes stop_codon:yes gene_type:complete